MKMHDSTILHVSKNKRPLEDTCERTEREKKAHAERQRKYYKETMEDPEKARIWRERKRKLNHKYYLRRKERLKKSSQEHHQMPPEAVEKKAPTFITDYFGPATHKLVQQSSCPEQIKELSELVSRTDDVALLTESANITVDSNTTQLAHGCELLSSFVEQLSPSPSASIQINDGDSTQHPYYSEDLIDINQDEFSRTSCPHPVSPQGISNKSDSNSIACGLYKSPVLLHDSSTSSSQFPHSDGPITRLHSSPSPEPQKAILTEPNGLEKRNNAQIDFSYDPPQWAALECIQLLEGPYWLNDEIINYFLRLFNEYLDTAELATDLYIGMPILRQFLILRSRSSRQNCISPEAEKTRSSSRYKRAVFLNNKLGHNEHWNVYYFDQATKTGRFYCTIYTASDDQDYTLYADFLKEAMGWRMDSGWTYNSVSEPCIKQTTTYDCGPLSCMIVVALAIGLDPTKLTFTAKEFRKLMCKAICAGKINSLPDLARFEPVESTAKKDVDKIGDSILPSDPTHENPPRKLAKLRRIDSSLKSKTEIALPSKKINVREFISFGASEESVQARSLPTSDRPMNRSAMFTTLDSNLLKDSILNTDSVKCIEQNGCPAYQFTEDIRYSLETFLSELDP
ncbi:uncharacterized protein VTP21DRAFT_2585, partial [Calcarisporiella thermophila]|uniref:uncharacterized protein n=1 Tax=Calcarisporiella thermophila TaxID=911321 RepID=UPI00374318F6